MMLRVVILVGVVALSGCADLLGDESSQVNGELRFRFSPEALVVELVADGEIPSDVVATVAGGGVTQKVLAGDFSGIGTARATFDSPISFEPGTDYSVTVTSGTATIAARSFTFLEEAWGEPRQDVIAFYEIQMQEDDGEMEMEIDGEATVEQRGDELRMSISGDGSMEMDADDMSMVLTISTFELGMVNEETTDGRTSGHGTWTMNSDGIQGSGTIDDFEMTFMGRDDRRDNNGIMVEAEKTHMTMHMTGDISGDGFSGTMEMDMDDTTWSRLDTGEDFWEKGTSRTTFTVDGESFDENDSYDQAVDAEETEPTLSDLMPDEGRFAWPLAVGDSYIFEGDGVRMEYSVTQGPNHDVRGVDTPTMQVSGRALSGATGTENLRVIATGAFAGLPTSWTTDATKGDQAYRDSLTLTRIS